MIIHVGLSLMKKMSSGGSLEVWEAELERWTYNGNSENSVKTLWFILKQFPGLQCGECETTSPSSP